MEITRGKGGWEEAGESKGGINGDGRRHCTPENYIILLTNVILISSITTKIKKIHKSLQFHLPNADCGDILVLSMLLSYCIFYPNYQRSFLFLNSAYYKQNVAPYKKLAIRALLGFRVK